MQVITDLFNFAFRWLSVSVFLLKSWNRSFEHPGGSGWICRGRLKESVCSELKYLLCFLSQQTAAYNSSFSCFIFSCLCHNRPHLLQHSAGFAWMLNQSRWQCLCLLACYWLQPRSGCPLSAHFRAGGGVLSTGWHAPRWTARVQENETSARWSLTCFQCKLWAVHMQLLNKYHCLFTACSASQSAPLLQFHWNALKQSKFIASCHFEGNVPLSAPVFM